MTAILVEVAVSDWLTRALSADEPEALIVHHEGQSLHLTLSRRKRELLLLLEEKPDHVLPSLDQYQLTPREREVLSWVAKGKTNRDIAEILGMSPRTVNKHLEQIFPKLGVENRTAAARVALKTLNKD